MSSSHWVWRLALMGSTALSLMACSTWEDSSDELGDAGVPGESGGGSGGSTGSGNTGGTGSGGGSTSPDGPITEFPARLDLGTGDCGSSVSTTFELANHGRAALTYSLLSSDPRIVVSPTTGTVAPAATISVQITAMVPETISAGTTLTAQIMAITNMPGSGARAIPVAFRSHGAQIIFDRMAIGFGQRPIGFTNNQSFTVSNVGDAPATVTIDAPSGEFSRRFGDAGAVMIAPGASVTGEVSYLPVDLGVDSAAASVTVTGARCGLLSPRLTLGGNGVAGTGVMVQGGPIEFGDVGCGIAPATQRVHLVNPSALE